MKAHVAILACLIVSVFLSAGCAWGDNWNKTDSQLTRDEAIRIAEATARSEGFDIQKYNVTGCHYEFTRKDRTWTVFFELKPPTPPGGHFMVSVHDQTKKATLMRGE
jgi:hypothetical protein